MTFFTSCQKTSSLSEKKEQHLSISLKKEPASLDPRKGNDMVASQIHFLLFEGLLRLNADMSLSPAMARSYEVSADRTLYTFHLTDSKWSDGTRVTAHDFEYAWKSMLDPAFASPDAYLLYCVKHAKAAKKGLVPLEEVGIRARDEKTLIVELDTPSPYFLQVVASSVLLPVNAHQAIHNPTWASSTNTLITNGPFRLKTWAFNQAMTFEKNPHYHAVNTVKLSSISVEFIDREMAVLHMYTSGHFDLIGSPLSFFPAMLQQDLEKKKLLTFFPVATTKFLSFNASSFPFNNKHIRKAFGLAINRKSIVKHITQLQEQEALNIIPPVLLSGTNRPLFTDGDIELARACLKRGLSELNKEAKEIGPLTFMYCSNEMNHILAQELQQKWREVLGIPVTLEHVDFQTLHQRSKTGEFSIGLFAWVADYGDPMNIFERFTDATNHRNYPKWENILYNHMLQDALAAPSRQKYLEKLTEAERILVDEMPLTCLYHENYAFLINPRVRGFEISPLGRIYFEKLSISPD